VSKWLNWFCTFSGLSLLLAYHTVDSGICTDKSTSLWNFVLNVGLGNLFTACQPYQNDVVNKALVKLCWPHLQQLVWCNLTITAMRAMRSSHTLYKHIHFSWHGTLHTLSATIESIITIRVWNFAGSSLKHGCWRKCYTISCNLQHLLRLPLTQCVIWSLCNSWVSFYCMAICWCKWLWCCECFCCQKR